MERLIGALVRSMIRRAVLKFSCVPTWLEELGIEKAKAVSLILALLIPPSERFFRR
jgi:hypothetical protein